MACRKKQPLLTTLEKRLERLTQGLDCAEVTDKSIEIVKEIKELSAILKNLREAQPSEDGTTSVCLVWGGENKTASTD
jgi:hypothetical protein